MAQLTTRWSALATLMLAPVIASEAWAQTSGGVRIELPAQSLASTLTEIARQTGTVIVAPGHLVKNRRSRPIAATAAVDALLAAALGDQGLAVRRTGAGVYVIVEAIDGAPPRNDEQAEPIVVTGRYFDSLASAAARDSLAESVSSAIDASNIADFPARNVAEALQRVPGVTVTEDRGEAVFVSVRGLEASFQIVTLNGSSIAVNENVRDSGQNGRQFRFDVIPAELVAGVDVVKSPLASMDEGATGAIINVRTFKPLDLPANAVWLNASASHPELADTVDPRLSVLGGWKSDAGDLGVLAGAAFSRRTLRQDRFTETGWIETAPGSPAALAGASFAPNSFRPTLEREERTRSGFNTSLQLRPDAWSSYEVEGFLVRLDSTYEELTSSAGFDFDTLDPATAIVRDGALVAGVANAGSQIGHEFSRISHDNLLVSASGAWSFDTFDVSAKILHTEAGSNTASPITRTRVSYPDVGPTAFAVRPLHDGAPDIRFLAADLNAPSTLPFRRIEYRDQRSHDSETSARIDARMRAGLPVFDDIEAGYRFRTRQRTYARQDALFTSGAGQYFPASFYAAFPVDDFLANLRGDLPRRWLQPVPEAFAAAAGFSPVFGEPTAADLRNSYDIRETIQSAYLMTRFDWSPSSDLELLGNAGVRVSHTDQVSSGHATGDQGATPVAFTTRYLDVLPSFNLAINAGQRWQTRLSLAKVITRPSLADLAPRLTLNSSGLIFEAVGGNPQLKRYQAWQADIVQSLSLASGGRVSVGAFHKQFDSFVFDRTSSILIDGTPYQLIAPTNGGRATASGLELSLQQKFSALPEPLDGFGVEANYTRVHTRADYGDGASGRLANVADESYSGSIIYEDGPLAVRAVYFFTGDILAASGQGGELSINRGRSGTLDMNFSYAFDARTELSLEAQNLTDEGRYLFAGDALFSGYTYHGRTIGLTLRYRSN